MENVNTTISTHNLSITYGNTTVLKNVNLELKKGRIYIILGPNGTGKSTLINCLSGDLKYQGEIKLMGKNLNHFNRKELAQTISKVQSTTLINNIKVEELIEMGRIPYTNFLGKLKKQDRDIIQNAIEMTGVQHLLSKSLFELSDGERRKVLITRNLVQDCPIVFMDEPTTFLDIGNTYQFYNLIKKVKSDQEKTILLSTHDLNLAFQLADSILLIRDHSITEHLPREVKEQKLLEEVFAAYKVKIDDEGKLDLNSDHHL